MSLSTQYNDERITKRSARQLQKITGVKYTVALRYIEETTTPLEGGGVHIHHFGKYGDPYEADAELIYRLRCVFCGGNTFAFPVKQKESK